MEAADPPRSDDAPLFNIVGTFVALGPSRRELVPHFHRWLNDFAMQRTLGNLPRSLTLQQVQARHEAVTQAEKDVVFDVYELSTQRLIGATTLRDIDHHHRTAEFVVFIGEPDCRGKGYGTEVARLMLDYAFTALGLHSVMLRVFEFNLAGRRAYEKAGFRECGRRRQCHFMGGRLWDEVWMDCLATEFTSPVLARIFVPDTSR